jgi:hypothetical protein
MQALMELARWSLIADIAASVAVFSLAFSGLVVLLLWRSKVVHDQNQGNK